MSEKYHEDRFDEALSTEEGVRPEAMIHRLRLNRAPLPDIVFTRSSRAYAPQRFNELLAALERVREASPQRYFYVWIEGSGLGSEWDQIYLMSSPDGVTYHVATWETGVRAFCGECEMLREHHNFYPRDDPRGKHAAEALGFEPLGGEDRGSADQDEQVDV